MVQLTAFAAHRIQLHGGAKNENARLLIQHCAAVQLTAYAAHRFQLAASAATRCNDCLHSLDAREKAAPLRVETARVEAPCRGGVESSGRQQLQHLFSIDRVELIKCFHSWIADTRRLFSILGDPGRGGRHLACSKPA